VLVVGSELISRKRDENGPLVALRLKRRGFEVASLSILPDDRAALAEEMRRALGDVALLVLTGGLGPTDDDLTREALSEATSCRMVEDPASRALIEERLARVGARASERSLRQALVPEGSRVVANVVGLAAGAVLPLGRAVIVLLPGPPSELAAMLEDALDGAVETLARAGVAIDAAPASLVEVVLAGIGESQAQARIEAVGDLAVLEVAWIARPGEVRLLLSGEAAPCEQARAAILATLGRHVVSTDGRDLAEVVVSTLTAREETLCTAESCTGGLLAGAVTSVPGSSSMFRRGFVTYADEAKAELLGVPSATLQANGAVSRETALAMASGARRAGRADWGLAVTGIAGPGGGTPEKPVGLVHVAAALPDARIVHEEHRLGGTRDDVRRRSVAAALDLVRRSL
jgi:nicotinamide-nucleotide amidase